MKHFDLRPAIGLALFAIAGAACAASATLVVPGTSNPFLAGQASGVSCCYGDSTPGESPVYAGSVVGGTTYTFTNVTGSVNYGGGTPTDPPDGNAGYLVSTPDYEGGAIQINGISGYLNAPIDALIGVFLSSSTPNPSAAPAELDFGPGGLTTSFSSLSPALQQTFFIGDGLTGTGSGSVQTFVAPEGATGLYLATVDGFGWNNNTGAITVTVNGLLSSVPEPAPGSLALSGLAVIGALVARRRARTGA